VLIDDSSMLGGSNVLVHINIMSDETQFSNIACYTKE
jgi:hypothetical protein